MKNMRVMNRILAIGLSTVMALSFVGCGNADTSVAPEDSVSSSAVEKDDFNFADYLGDEIIEIAKVENGEQLDSICETYRFIFLSDMEKKYKIKGFISIPLSCIETRTPCQCMVFCN